MPEKFEAFGWHVIRMDAHNFDAIDAAKKSVAAGELDATVLQDVETIGQKTVEVAIEMCKGEKVDDVYNVDPVLLTKDNIADYVTE